MLDRLGEVIDRHAARLGQTTAVPRLLLSRNDDPVTVHDLAYEPMLCLVVAGAKHAEMGSRVSSVKRGEISLSVVRAPVLVNFDVPYRAAVLRIDDSVLAAVIARTPRPRSESRLVEDGFCTAGADRQLLHAVVRLVELLDQPEHVPMMAPLLEQEIIYRLLLGPVGFALRASIGSGPLAPVRQVAAYLTDHADEPITIADLTRLAGVSAASLHRHFRQVTGLSPMQFLRAARLQRARQLLITGERTAASVAHSVGYLSPSQFSRDYRQRYGEPPRRHTRGELGN